MCTQSHPAYIRSLSNAGQSPCCEVARAAYEEIHVTVNLKRTRHAFLKLRVFSAKQTLQTFYQFQEVGLVPLSPRATTRTPPQSPLITYSIDHPAHHPQSSHTPLYSIYTLDIVDITLFTRLAQLRSTLFSPLLAAIALGLPFDHLRYLSHIYKLSHTLPCGSIPYRTAHRSCI